MAENREITLFSEPEELIAWAEVYDKQINPSIEDAALVLCQDLVQVKMRNFSPF